MDKRKAEERMARANEAVGAGEIDFERWCDIARGCMDEDEGIKYEDQN
jgi:hypothetical protein